MHKKAHGKSHNLVEAMMKAKKLYLLAYMIAFIGPAFASQPLLEKLSANQPEFICTSIGMVHGFEKTLHGKEPLFRYVLKIQGNELLITDGMQMRMRMRYIGEDSTKVSFNYAQFYFAFFPKSDSLEYMFGSTDGGILRGSYGLCSKNR